MSMVPGTNLGVYRIVEQVGRGGMAVVYKAYQPGLARYVAIKILPQFIGMDEEARARFQKEAIAIARLRHPNILLVFDYGEQDGVAYLVSEFVDGGTLEQHLGQPLTVAHTVRMLGPIAAALDYAHAQGILHRDVKPSNILLAGDGTPVLADFGLARIMGAMSRLTRTGMMMGTPEYMAPEQGEGQALSAASDAYGLAVVAYEMLTGRVPFSGETPIAVLLAHMHRPLPLPRSLNPDLPVAVEEVLVKGLAKQPGDRYPTVSAFIGAFASAAGVNPPTGVPATAANLAGFPGVAHESGMVDAAHTPTPGGSAIPAGAPAAPDGPPAAVKAIVGSPRRSPALILRAAVAGVVLVLGALAVFALHGSGGSSLPATATPGTRGTSVAHVLRSGRTQTPAPSHEATHTQAPPRMAQATATARPALSVPPTALPGGGGHITYKSSNGHIYRVAAQAGAPPQDLTLALNRIAPGSNDQWLNISPNGAWLVLSTQRFDPGCAAEACLALVRGDLSAGATVRAGGGVIHPEGFGAVSSTGTLIVYSGGGGPHMRDLYAVVRTGSVWRAPLLLSGTSPYAYNEQPSLAYDGSTVVFECGNRPFADTGTALCTAGTHGSGFRVLLTPADPPPGQPRTGLLQEPSYAPDGSIVFEGAYAQEQVWRLPVRASRPVKVTDRFNNDNSPCALPDGRIASLWLDRPGGAGANAIKVMAPDGSGFAMVPTGKDVADIGIGCGR